jgi:transglutaminase-like putative cysteine protease
MQYYLGCELRYCATVPTTLFLNVEAQANDLQTVQAQSFAIDPNLRVDTCQVDNTANVYRRVILPPGECKVRYSAEVVLSPEMRDPSTVDEIAVADLPFHTLPYLYPSRYCQSDRMRHFVWREFGGGTRGHALVTEICTWIHQKVDYIAGTSQAETSAYDTFTRRAGVCRDFAHLGITFCRALGIPARFVSGYCWKLKPADFHAVFEAYLGGRWYLFDATRMCPLNGLVRIGVGRDAADTAFATYYGEIEDAPKLVWIERRDMPAVDGLRHPDWAISTAAL